jgi:hypothetical protein
MSAESNLFGSYSPLTAWLLHAIALAASGTPVIEINCHPRDGDPAHFQSPARFGAITELSMLLSPRTTLTPCTYTCSSAEPHCIRRSLLKRLWKQLCEMMRKTPPSGVAAVAIGHE